MNSMKVRLNLYILLVVFLCTTLVSVVLFFNANKLHKMLIENEKADLKNTVLKELIYYQSTIDLIEQQIARTSKTDIIQKASALSKHYARAEDVPVKILEGLAADLGMDHVFLIDSMAIIRNTTLAAELNYDLKNEGESFYNFFKKIFRSNSFHIYSWGVSSVDNSLTIYCYYVPEGASYMFETSIEVENYFDNYKSNFLLKQGLHSLKIDIPKNHDLINSIDIFNMNESFNASILNENVQLKLSDEEWLFLNENKSLVRDIENGELFFALIELEENSLRFLPKIVLQAEFNFAKQAQFLRQILLLNLIVLLIVLLFIALTSPILIDRLFIHKISKINFNLNALRFANYDALQTFKGNDELSEIGENILHVKDAIVEREHQLKESKLLAESADRLKSAFLANMSHEIRTPLNAVVGFAQLLKDANPSPKDTEVYTDLISTNSYKLLQIINDIIDLAQIESGQLKIVNRPICLNDIFTELYGFAQSKLHGENLIGNEKNIVVIVDTDKKLAKSCILSDPHRLRQIMEQLIDNAIKFTCKGEIHIGYKMSTEFINLFVTDTGVGIERKDLSKIFGRFVQAEDYMTREHGGTGLGLAICNELAKLLNGSIHVESEFTKGSTFSIRIPNIKSSL